MSTADTPNILGPTQSELYEHLQGSVQLQLQTSELLDSKARTLFAIASGVAGFAIPLSLTALGANKEAPDWLVYYVVLPALPYLFAAVSFVRVYKARRYWFYSRTETMIKVAKFDDETIRSYLFDTLRKAHENNEVNNNAKAAALGDLLLFVIIETVVALCYSVAVVLVPTLV